MSRTDFDLIIAAAATRFVRARRARIATKQARAAYWAKAYPVGEEGYPRGYHHYGTCEERMTQGSEGPYVDERKPLCAVCQGSEPSHQAYRAAAKECGLALRALQRAVDATSRATTTTTGTP